MRRPWSWVATDRAHAAREMVAGAWVLVSRERSSRRNRDGAREGVPAGVTTAFAPEIDRGVSAKWSSVSLM